ncbi:hypothetical protein IHE44_0003073 [Lamprotornis superbus]|uniref:Uncharacterized protein n=1 Tax=Lamprotornis superbus TaxID=245042 RepID=A0A835TXA4_9PASS|nr:hypothetical protein IHE44_0003073 [Lamprotornis superbus]
MKIREEDLNIVLTQPICVSGNPVTVGMSIHISSIDQISEVNMTFIHVLLWILQNLSSTVMDIECFDGAGMAVVRLGTTVHATLLWDWGSSAGDTWCSDWALRTLEALSQQIPLAQDPAMSSTLTPAGPAPFQADMGLQEKTGSLILYPSSPCSDRKGHDALWCSCPPLLFFAL